jgi:hypothetical protein
VTARMPDRRGLLPFRLAGLLSGVHRRDRTRSGKGDRRHEVPLTLDVLSDRGDRVAAIHRLSMVKDGETVQQTEVLLFTFVDGKAPRSKTASPTSS